MLEHIGARVRKKLEALPFVKIAGGYTEPIVRDDNGTARTFAACRPWPGAPCEATSDYVNLSPHEGAGCIAFVDGLEEVRVVRSTSRYDEIETVFRVVVWYDQRQVLAGDNSDTARAMANEIIKAVQGTDFETAGLPHSRARFLSSTGAVNNIWSRYGMGIDDRALFVYPYRTFAVSFKFNARHIPSCFCADIITTAASC